jgi:hypothetical protein
MRTPYPDIDPAAVQTPDLELVAAWACQDIWELMASAGDQLPLLSKVWSSRPTMIHPTHVVPLADEVALVLTRVAADAATQDEMERVQALCADASAAGGWLVSIGP